VRTIVPKRMTLLTEHQTLRTQIVKETRLMSVLKTREIEIPAVTKSPKLAVLRVDQRKNLASTSSLKMTVRSRKRRKVRFREEGSGVKAEAEAEVEVEVGGGRAGIEVGIGIGAEGGINVVAEARG